MFGSSGGILRHSEPHGFNIGDGQDPWHWLFYDIQDFRFDLRRWSGELFLLSRSWLLGRTPQVTFLASVLVLCLSDLADLFAVVDAFLLAEVIDLLPVVTDAVKAGDIDSRVLASPGICASPLLQDRVIAAAFDVIDGEFLRLLGLAGATSQNRHG